MTAPPPEVIATMRPAISAGWFYVPYEAIGNEAKIAAEKKKLTWRSKHDSAAQPIRMFKDLPPQGYLGMPRDYGMLRYPWLPVDDQTTLGEPMIQPIVRLPDPNHPSVKEPELQAKFMDEMERATYRDKHFIAYATTGSGKTIVGSRNARLLGRRTAILVPLERLLDQWRKELMDKLGVTEDRIGLVQGNTCDWQERDWVLCMMKSLGSRRYPSEFYNSIGLVMPDECHRLGTPELAMTTALFPARYRTGLSATPERSDGSDRAIFWHIGQIKVRSEASAVDCDIYTLQYDDNGRMAAIPPLVQREGEPKKSDHGFRIKKLTEDFNRNRVLARMVYRLWKAGHQVLAIGEHVGHVQTIMEMVIAMGVPAAECGQCTAERHNYQERVVNGVLIRRKVGTTKIKREEFERAKTQSKIVFATYGCFKEGIDEPRLDALVTLTPQAKDKQVRGRVRRPYTGKVRAIYVSMVDVGDWMSMRYYRSRLREWGSDANCRVIHGKI